MGQEVDKQKGRTAPQLVGRHGKVQGAGRWSWWPLAVRHQLDGTAECLSANTEPSGVRLPVI